MSSLPTGLTRCFGVLGVNEARASLKRDVVGVEMSEGGMFSSVGGSWFSMSVVVVVVGEFFTSLF